MYEVYTSLHGVLHGLVHTVGARFHVCPSHAHAHVYSCMHAHMRTNLHGVLDDLVNTVGPLLGHIVAGIERLHTCIVCV